MPKIKVHSGAAKRFKKTGSGLKRKQANKRHILTKDTDSHVALYDVLKAQRVEDLGVIQKLKNNKTHRCWQHVYSITQRKLPQNCTYNDVR